MKTASLTIVGLIIGGVGGVAFFVLDAPMPWMLGAMIATALAAILGLPVTMPRWLRNAFVPVLGVMFGSLLAASALPGVTTILGLLAVLAASIVVTTALGSVYFRLFGLDLVTSCFAALPGSLSEVVILAERLPVDVKVIALVHTARLMFTISAIAFILRYLLEIDLTTIAAGVNGRDLGIDDVLVLAGCAVAGYGAAALVRLPAPQMFGPLALSALAHAAGLTDGQPPDWLLSAAQVMLGVFIGARFTGVGWRETSGVIAMASGWAALLLPITAALAYGTARLLEISFETALLMLTPGGAAEVSMIAVGAGVSLGFISVAQFIRILLIVTGTAFAARRLARPSK